MCLCLSECLYTNAGTCGGQRSLDPPEAGVNRQLWAVRSKGKKLNPGPPQEQYMLLITESSLQPPTFTFRRTSKNTDRISWFNPVRHHCLNLICLTRSLLLEGNPNWAPFSRVGTESVWKQQLSASLWNTTVNSQTADNGQNSVFLKPTSPSTSSRVKHNHSLKSASGGTELNKKAQNQK